MDEAVAWLRAEIERDLQAAKIISDGGFEPERWDTLPPGQVNPASIELGNAVSDALGLEENERPCGWVAIHAWNRLNNEPPEADSLEWGAPVALVDSGRRQFVHIRRQDPRNTIARCEAELAILDEHGFDTIGKFGDEGPPRCLVCLTDRESYEEFWEADPWPCLTVRSLASGYRHRPGYAEHWGEKAATS